MNAIEISVLLKEVEFENYRFVVGHSQAGMYLQAKYLEPDIVTGAPETQSTRKWILSEHMTRSEVVQTAFKCCLTSMEHRAREMFKYKGKRIFGPHYNIDSLWEICNKENFDVRPKED